MRQCSRHQGTHRTIKVAVLGSLRQKAKPVLSEEIGYGVEHQMMSVGYLLDIVLDHRRSSDDLDVDRHARPSFAVVDPAAK
jgi:hypothetical protein